MVQAKPNESRTKRAYCSSCETTRIHRLATRVDDSGCFVRMWICTVPTCCLSFPAGGFVCQICGHDRLTVCANGAGRYARPGAITRLKVCDQCGTGYHTCERIERQVGIKTRPPKRGGLSVQRQADYLRAEVRRLRAALARAKAAKRARPRAAHGKPQ